MGNINPYPVTTDWLLERVSSTPKAIALIDRTTKKTVMWQYDELDGLVWQLCRHLTSLGVLPEMNVAMLLPNSLAYVVHIYALIRIGAKLVPLNTRLTAGELQRQVAMAGCAALVCSSSMREKGLKASHGFCQIIEVPENPEEFSALLNEMNTRSIVPEIKAQPMEACQTIIFTSGTSGTPKGASLSYANHFWSATASAFRIGVNPSDRWLACMPLYHVGGLAILFRSCLYGTAVILHHGFDVGEVIDSLQSYRATLVSLVPTMLYRLLHEFHDNFIPPALRLVLLGGAAASISLLNSAELGGLPVALTYGLTEAASQVATALPDQVRQKPGSAGRPQIFTSIRILDQNGNPLPTGEIGEIAISGPTVMVGYYADEQATKMAMRNQMLLSGDMGYLDSDGDLWVLDRREDLIISGGENVYPAEVEAVLRAYPAIREVCVVGLPHPEWGQQVVAAIVADSPDVAIEADLVSYCRTHLAGYKQPRQFVFVDEIPQTGSGKIQRSVVANELASLELRT
jgi:O-succinylbenzoic acid--CoA ligase